MAAEIDRRVMRLALPVTLIREMDQAILDGLGGYSTRAEFILDAIQERLVDLMVADEVDAGAPIARRGPQVQPAPLETLPAIVEERMSEIAGPPPSEAMTISSPPRGYVAEGVVSSAGGQPLFGLHNRDYPSIWALERLAGLTPDTPVAVDEYFDRLLSDAWTFGAQLRELESSHGGRYAGMFPTNHEKRKSAEAAFRTFAVGDYRLSSDGVVSVSGPLFEWGVAIVMPGDDEAVVGMTSSGWSLLSELEGLTAVQPHPEPMARAFLAHLVASAPGDLAGFSELLQAIGAHGASRSAVLEHFARTWPAWTANEVSTNVAGYVARAREWGLIDMKQIAGQYQLTPFGVEKLESTMEEAD